MFLRNAYTKKPKNGVWSNLSPASQLINNEFFGVAGGPTISWGKIKVSGTFVSISDRKFKVGGAFVSAVDYKVKVGGVFVSLV